jgi:hypothetical protein
MYVPPNTMPEIDDKDKVPALTREKTQHSNLRKQIVTPSVVNPVVRDREHTDVGENRDNDKLPPLTREKTQSVYSRSRTIGLTTLGVTICFLKFEYCVLSLVKGGSLSLSPLSPTSACARSRTIGLTTLGVATCFFKFENIFAIRHVDLNSN